MPDLVAQWLATVDGIEEDMFQSKQLAASFASEGHGSSELAGSGATGANVGVATYGQ